MPSPFPGMDPYLEHPDIFGNLHQDFIFCLKEQLQPELPDPYYARSQRRTWIDVSERYVEPDTNVQVAAAYRPKSSDASSGGAIAVEAAATTGPIIIHVPHDECREAYAEIYVGRGSDRRLVTSIEVLSPTNKGRSGKGRELYLQKQQEMMESEVNLVEIDLLRGGTHTTAVPLDRLRELAPNYQYHVCIHRFDRWEDFFVYPFRLQDPLPKIDVPLLPEDGTVQVDLQVVFNRCYEVGVYRHDVDYLKDEVLPPLSREDADWARELVASAG